MSEYSACAEAADFEQQILAIEDEVLDETINNDSTAKQETILEAITTRRSKTNKNDYTPVDVFVAAEKAAREIGKKWQCTVAPEQ